MQLSIAEAEPHCSVPNPELRATCRMLAPSARSRTNARADQIAFKLGDSRYDGKQRLPQGAAGVGAGGFSFDCLALFRRVLYRELVVQHVHYLRDPLAKILGGLIGLEISEVGANECNRDITTTLVYKWMWEFPSKPSFPRYV